MKADAGKREDNGQTGSLGQPLRLLVLDTSHFSELAGFRRSQKTQARTRKFEARLLEQGYVLLLSIHHFDELIQHADDALVDARIKFLASLSHVVWIRDHGGALGLGGVLDILVAEAEAQLRSPTMSLLQVRDAAKEKMFLFGSGRDAIGGCLPFLDELRALAIYRAQRHREIIATQHADVFDMSDVKLSTFRAGQKRNSGDSVRVLDAMRTKLVGEINERGDKRMGDIRAHTSSFFQDVLEKGAQLDEHSAVDLVDQIAQLFGVDPDALPPDATMRDLEALATFCRQLEVAAGVLGLPLADLRARCAMERTPSCVVQEGLRTYRQDTAERKGSELTDRYLGCLAPYADITFVDKRTKENFQKASRKDPVFKSVQGRVEKARNIAALERLLADSES
ncbi:hypothetical protein Plav_1045 [Parvibaculum lavamentivorans DS-1]|uniref:Uncharacterized protein n=1 Tax=Parvibaculum lavamentivorans (strain DS-1 / DSM 13023 / NCIMB 13966) TaxID=402881 RepID=A7HRY4_PARL1|nr:hypothetical protein [Parvibaculum lavamentivorans]ABS62667.1 hypothetical protein Plav_1045 [Parvibaculum lavamentivorans DS-1]